MSRYVKQYKITANKEAILNFSHNYFLQNGYNQELLGMEQVYHKANGWFGAPKYVKISVFDDVLRIEGWFKWTILPYVFVGELTFDNNSFIGAFPKSQMKKLVFEYERLLAANNLVGEVVYNFNGGMPQYQKPQYQPPQPHYQQSQIQQFNQPQYQQYNNSQKICPNCSAVITDGVFCSKCGTRIG